LIKPPKSQSDRWGLIALLGEAKARLTPT